MELDEACMLQGNLLGQVLELAHAGVRPARTETDMLRCVLRLLHYPGFPVVPAEMVSILQLENHCLSQFIVLQLPFLDFIPFL